MLKQLPDEERKEQILRKVMAELSEVDFALSPPAIAGVMFDIIMPHSANDDPYRQVKDDSNRHAMELYPQLRQQVEDSAEPFNTALRMAVAGNIIDFGALHDFSLQKISGYIQDALTAPMDEAAIRALQRDIEAAETILYLGDNCGEIVFDRLLVSQMPRHKVVFAVRGAPVINDATLADAETVGLTAAVEVISNGDNLPGTVLERCSDEFRDHWRRADLVIAKGQGNYETLSEVDKKIYFLLKVKCPVVAADLGVQTGSCICCSAVGSE